MLRTHYSNQVKAGEAVRVGGWAQDIRNMGKLMFLTLRDREGIVQVTVKADNPLFPKFKEIHKETLITVSGNAVKNDRAPGGLELVPDSLEVIANSESPLPIDVGKIESNFDRRLDWRFIDMRRPEVMAVFRLESEITHLMEEFMQKEDFLRIFSSRLTGAATEGGTEYFPILYFNKEAFLAQSPQLIKESVLASGIDRVYDIGFVYRAEPHHTPRHLCEYASFDLEMVAQNLEEVLAVEEKMMQFIFSELNKRCKHILDMYKITLEVPKKIPRVTFDEANEILKKMKIETEKTDLTPEGERKLCEWAQKEHGTSFVFVTEFPFAKKPFYIMRKGKEGTLSFDLLYNGLEITSGGIREHRYDERVANIKAKGINPESFDHLRFFKYGMPPHGGLAIGIERLTMKILNLENVREASLTPRDTERLTP